MKEKIDMLKAIIGLFALSFMILHIIISTPFSALIAFILSGATLTIYFLSKASPFLIGMWAFNTIIWLLISLSSLNVITT